MVTDNIWGQGSGSWMKDVGTRRGSRHDQGDLVEMCPSVVSECLRMLLDVVIPG